MWLYKLLLLLALIASWLPFEGKSDDVMGTDESVITDGGQSEGSEEQEESEEMAA